MRPPHFGAEPPKKKIRPQQYYDRFMRGRLSKTEARETFTGLAPGAWRLPTSVDAECQLRLDGLLHCFAWVRGLDMDTRNAIREWTAAYNAMGVP